MTNHNIKLPSKQPMEFSMTEIEGRSLSRAKKECKKCDWLTFLCLALLVLTITFAHLYVNSYEAQQRAAMRTSMTNAEGSWAVFCDQAGLAQATNTPDIAALAAECK